MASPLVEVPELVEGGEPPKSIESKNGKWKFAAMIQKDKIGLDSLFSPIFDNIVSPF